MTKNLIFILTAMLLTIAAVNTSAQTMVKGQIVDAQTNEPLIGATVTVKGSTKGTITNFDGFFIVNVPGNITSLTVKYLGYKEVVRELPQAR